MKKLAVILLAVCMMLSLSVYALAASIDDSAHSGNVLIGTTVSDTHTITSNADDADIFLDGKPNTVFTVDRLSEPRLLIRPQANKEITQVLLNNKDVTDKLSGGYLELPPVHEDLQLTVLTAKTATTETGFFTLEGVVVFNNEPLKSVTLELHSEPQTCVTDENGAFKFNRVEFGHHTLTALQNNNAIGYCEININKDDTVAIGSNEAENFSLSFPKEAKGLFVTLDLADDGKMQPTDIKEIKQTHGSPQTGDNSNAALQIIVMFASGVMLILLIAFRKRKRL